MTQYDTDPDFWAKGDRRPNIRKSVRYSFRRLLKLAGLAN